MMEETEFQFREMAALLGDRARAAMLWTLLDGRAYTATELSLCAGISPQSASNHLAKLIKASLLVLEKQGRYRYYRFASAEVALAIEAMASLLPVSRPPRQERAVASGITYARTCYDHMAGRVGVAIADAMVENRIIAVVDKGYEIGPAGRDWFMSLGIEVEKLRLRKRSFAYQCLDWSERRHHLAGALGASLLHTMLKNGWIRKIQYSRQILVTPFGKMALGRTLGLEI